MQCTHSCEMITCNIVNAQLLEGYSLLFWVCPPSPPKAKLNFGTTMYQTMYRICMQPMPLWPSCTVEENEVRLFLLIRYSVDKNVKPAKKLFSICLWIKFYASFVFWNMHFRLGKTIVLVLPKNLELIAIIFNLNGNCFPSSFFNVHVPLAETDFLYPSLKTTVAKIWFLKINSKWYRG